VGYEPTVTAFERAKKFHALDGAAIMTGNIREHQPEVLLRDEDASILFIFSQ
jgi:hypothetical protein